MTSQITPKPGVDRIALYQGGASSLPGRIDVLKLSSNENPFGVPEAAQKAVAASAAHLHRYPSTDHGDLRAAIAEVHELDADRIICGAGSDEVIEFLCQAYAGEGTEVIYTEHGFSMYKISAFASGAAPVEVPERDRQVDVDAVLAGVTDKTRLVFIANPANPTGTMIPAGEAARLAEALPPHVILVLDGAYAEYVDGYDGGAALVEARDNVVMTRTFSKLYGLGGLRIGWGYGPKAIIDNLNRVRGPFNLSNAQLAAGVAAVRDRDWAETAKVENAKNRAVLARGLADLGVPSDPSEANFILARFADEAEANDCEAALREDGILVRKVPGYGLPQCLRITAGSATDCARVIASVARFRESQA
ncbi:MAG: histidinol-phosphate transaminase [Silicimonas sp.]|nr:histidinol-phosphate transaminase [Silicimonas sp.]